MIERSPISEKIENIREKYRINLDQIQQKISDLDTLDRRGIYIRRSNDQGLSIDQNNCSHYIYGYNDYTEGSSYSFSNFLEYPELREDPVFSVLKRVYNHLLDTDNGIEYLGNSHNKSLQEVYDHICCMATKMAFRKMTELEYNAILSEEDEVLMYKLVK